MPHQLGRRKLNGIIENLDKKAKTECGVMVENMNAAVARENVSTSETGEVSLNDLKSLMVQISKDITSSEKKLSLRIDALKSDLEGT